MKRFANALASTLRRVSLQGTLMRLAILLLPWQTRYFIEGPDMGGFPWEQGRWSLYASMLVMAATMILAAYRESRRVAGQHLQWLRAIATVAFFLLPALSLTATLQGFAQVLLLALFVWTVWRDQAFRAKAPFWIVLSLAPVALFAVAQTLFQWVPAIKWLGVAVHDPLARGTSVIEIGSERFLRAYGPFPHPNVLGGWMVLGLFLSWRGWMSREGRPWLYLVAASLFAVALYVSFSRSAWIACVVGIGGVLWRAGKNGMTRRLLLAMAVCALLIGGLVAMRPELVRTRIVSQQRLETKSVNERKASVAQGLDVVRAYPFGTGFQAYRAGLEQACSKKSCLVPSEPPHLVPLLALAELGWLRFAAAVCAIGWLCWRGRVWKRSSGLFLLPLLVIAALDHYLWSLWAGQALVAMAFLVAGNHGVDKEASARHDRGTEA